METASVHLALPRGWIMQKSKTYPDRVYYFNTLTGVSSWALPGAASHSDEKAASVDKNKSKPISSKKLRTPEKYETRVLGLRIHQNSHEKQQQKEMLSAADSKSHTSLVVGRLKKANQSSELLLEDCTREQNKTQMWSSGCPKLLNTNKGRTCERVAKDSISHTLAGDVGCSLEQNKLGHLAVPVATDFGKIVDPSLCRKTILSDTPFKTLHPDCKLKDDNLKSSKKRKKRKKKKGIHSSHNETDDKQDASKLSTSGNKQSLEGICSTIFKKQSTSLFENSLHKVSDSSKNLKKQRRKRSMKSVCPKSKTQQCSADGQKKDEPRCDSALSFRECQSAVCGETRFYDSTEIAKVDGSDSVVNKQFQQDSGNSSDGHLRTQHLSAVSRAVTQGADVLSGSAVSVLTSELEPSSPGALAMEVEYDEDDNDVVMFDIQEIQEHIRMLNPAVNQVMGMLTETVQKVSTLQIPSPLTPHPDNQAIFIIIDTNVLIQSLGFIKNLRDLTVKEWGQPHLVIPWVVLQELDSLKENKYKMALGGSVQAQAREAVRYLHSCLISAHPRVIGQTPADAYQVCQGSGFVMVNNDDRIINCCLQYRQKYPQSAVQLLTEDKNLQNKAMVIGLHCSNVKTLNCKLKENKASKVTNKGELISVPKSAFILDNAKQHAKDSESHVPDYDSERDLVMTQEKKFSQTKETKIKEILLSSKTTPCILEAEANAAKTAMDRFEAVWSTINNGCSMAEEKVKGQLTPEEKTAIRETILNFIPLLRQLHSQFDQCLTFSPVSLENHTLEFDQFCTSLNNFFLQAKIPVPNIAAISTSQMIALMSQGKNRVTLGEGLKQLADFITRLENIWSCLQV